MMGTNRWNEAIFVDGEFRAPRGGGVLNVRDKASGETFAVAGLADSALSGRSAELRELIMRETGCIGGKADYEIGAATGELADHASRAAFAVRAGASRAGRRDHPVELPAGARHARDRARARARQRGADQAVTGDPAVGRARDRRAVRRRAAVAEGATVVAGRTANAPFFQPTVVTEVPTGSALWTEEIFAPIAPVVAVKDADEAIALANDTGYGLVNSVVTAA